MLGWREVVGARKHTNPHHSQGDLFAHLRHAELFPVRQRVREMRAPDLSLRIKTAMGRALKECPLNAYEIAARMSEMTGREITADALYAYTAASKPEHEISLLRFIAFVRATGATWLWDLLVEDDGLIVLADREAHLAQLGLLRQEKQKLDDQIRAIERDLRHSPVDVARRPRARGR
jgi:hypothetical protein